MKWMDKMSSKYFLKNLHHPFHFTFKTKKQKWIQTSSWWLSFLFLRWFLLVWCKDCLSRGLIIFWTLRAFAFAFSLWWRTTWKSLLWRRLWIWRHFFEDETPSINIWKPFKFVYNMWIYESCDFMQCTYL